MRPNDYKNTSSKNTKKASTGENREQKTGTWMSKLQCQGGFENWSCVTNYIYPRSM